MVWLALYFGLWVAGLRFKRVPLVRFDFVVTATWLASVLISFVPLINFARGVSDRAVMLVLLSHLGLLIGFYALGGSKSQTFTYEGGKPRDRLLPAITCVFVVASFGRALQQGRMPVLGTFRNIQSIRNAYLESGLIGRVDSIIAILQYVAIVYVVLIPVHMKHHQRWKVMLGIAAFVGVAETSLATGGRASIVFSLVGLAASYVICFQPKIRHYIGLITVATIAAFVLGGTFVTQRNQDFARDPRTYLAYNCLRADFGSLVDRESTTQMALASASCYFSSPIYSFDLFINDVDEDWRYRNGAYSAGLLFRDELLTTRRDVADYFRWQQLAENGWSTAVRDMWIDFGNLAPVGFVLLGGGVGWLTARRRLTNELELARVALTAPFGFMVPFISPLIIPALIYPIAATVALGVVARRHVRPAPSSFRRMRSAGPYLPLRSSRRLRRWPS